MQVFEDGGEVVQMVALAAAHAGRQQKEQGPHPFPAAEQDVPAHFGDERHVGLEVGHQRLIDRGHLSFQLFESALAPVRRGLMHVKKITYFRPEVNYLGSSWAGRRIPTGSFPRPAFWWIHLETSAKGSRSIFPRVEGLIIPPAPL